MKFTLYIIKSNFRMPIIKRFDMKKTFLPLQTLLIFFKCFKEKAATPNNYGDAQVFTNFKIYNWTSTHLRP
jgi:hypothetical protein